jgi:seryl-tRNA synthetase
MHDIKAIRDDSKPFIEGLKRRGFADAQQIADKALARDKELRALQTRLQEMQALRNEASRLIGQAKVKKDEAGAKKLLIEVAGLKDEIQKGEEKERELQRALTDFLAGIPNTPAPDVPIGKDEKDKKEVKARAFGTPPSIATPKDHVDLGAPLGMDFEAAARMSGARFVVLKDGLARLERAIGAFMLDIHTSKSEHSQFNEQIEIGGYAEVSPPLMMRDDKDPFKNPTYGTGQLPKFADDLFKVAEKTDWEAFRQKIADGSIPNTLNTLPLRAAIFSTGFWLIPTAEVSLTNLVREQILDEEKLPHRFTAYTPCFRAEAGAAGKDTRGMIRLHQFSKVELVSITTQEQSEAEHERMTDCAQEVLKRLNLHHRVMALCTGDMGFAAKKTYDIEVWLPGQNAFREISSCSNCGDFQARRMDARYRAKGEKHTRFVHTLNGSGLAVGRTLIAILENYQQPDGSITVPDALKPYMGGQTRLAP